MSQRAATIESLSLTAAFEVVKLRQAISQAISDETQGAQRAPFAGKNVLVGLSDLSPSNRVGIDLGS
jgi:hypothetical protein